MMETDTNVITKIFNSLKVSACGLYVYKVKPINHYLAVKDNKDPYQDFEININKNIANLRIFYLLSYEKFLAFLIQLPL